jgi:CheY-like chemotaxis protein
MTRSILMLEHDDDERYIAQSVFDDHHYDIKIHFVETSNEVFSYLNQCERNKTRFPSLILLDYLATPSNAIEILNELKSNSRFSHIPVVVLSGAVKGDVIQECYAAGASSFIQKPAETKEAENKVGNFVKYWFQTVELP